MSKRFVTCALRYWIQGHVISNQYTTIFEYFTFPNLMEIVIKKQNCSCKKFYYSKHPLVFLISKGYPLNSKYAMKQLRTRVDFPTRTTRELLQTTVKSSVIVYESCIFRYTAINAPFVIMIVKIINIKIIFKKHGFV